MSNVQNEYMKYKAIAEATGEKVMTFSQWINKVELEEKLLTKKSTTEEEEVEDGGLDIDSVDTSDSQIGNEFASKSSRALSAITANAKGTNSLPEKPAVRIIPHVKETAVVQNFIKPEKPTQIATQTSPAIKVGTPGYKAYIQDVSVTLSDLVAPRIAKSLEEKLLQLIEEKSRDWTEYGNFYDAMREVTPDFMVMSCKLGYVVQILHTDMGLSFWKVVSAIKPTPHEALQSALESKELSYLVAEKFPLPAMPYDNQFEEENAVKAKYQSQKEDHIKELERTLRNCQIRLDEAAQSKNYKKAAEIETQMEQLEESIKLAYQTAGIDREKRNILQEYVESTPTPFIDNTPQDTLITRSIPESMQVPEEILSDIDTVITKGTEDADFLIEMAIGKEVIGNRMYHSKGNGTTVKGVFAGRVMPINDGKALVYGVKYRTPDGKLRMIAIKEDTIIVMKDTQEETIEK